MKIYATEIECVDEKDEIIFKLKTFDLHTATIEIKTLLSNSNIDEILQKVKDALNQLELES